MLITTKQAAAILGVGHRHALNVLNENESVPALVGTAILWREAVVRRIAAERRKNKPRPGPKPKGKKP